MSPRAVRSFVATSTRFPSRSQLFWSTSFFFFFSDRPFYGAKEATPYVAQYLTKYGAQPPPAARALELADLLVAHLGGGE